jgi:very-short-patch-repair endonuclease
MKSCDKHAYCNKCRPEVGKKIGKKSRGRVASKETREKIRIAGIGRVVSLETREKMRAANSDHVVSDERRANIREALRNNPRHGEGMARRERNRGMSPADHFVNDVLLADFPEVIWQQPFASYVVDFYIPSHHLAFEVDGWHHGLKLSRKYDARRDARLLAEYDLPVVRLTVREIDQWRRPSNATVVSLSREE